MVIKLYSSLTFKAVGCLSERDVLLLTAQSEPRYVLGTWLEMKDGLCGLLVVIFVRFSVKKKMSKY